MNKSSQNEVKTADSAVTEIAETEGLAVVVVENDRISSVTASNDNSICEVLSGSDEFAPACRRYCGSVFNKAVAKDKPQKYRCHAGLDCIAVPLRFAERKPLVAIIGRTFTKADEYRKATERAISGDWKHFPPTSFFENVLLSSSGFSVEKAARRMADLNESEKARIFGAAEGGPADKNDVREVPVEVVGEIIEDREPVGEAPVSEEAGPAEESVSSWRSKMDSMLDLSYREACRTVVDHVAERYSINSVAWLEIERNSFEKIYSIGGLKDQKIQISVAADDKALLRLLEKESSIELRERGKQAEDSADSLRLFPITVSGVIQSGLVIGEKTQLPAVVKSIAGFCRSIATELEILRLRDELSRRTWLGAALGKFNESLKMIDTDDFWLRLMQTTAELMQAERGSLMIWDEDAEKLAIKAAIGRKADLIKSSEREVGERISLKVWHSGRPVVVQDIGKLRMAEAPADWNYATRSFISYPLLVGDRKIGVINITDKAGGGQYDEFDLQLMNSIVPQIAVAVDRAVLKGKAGEFEQLSVTDALTGLLNRRYLSQRLSEEIKRSNRHGYPMCFLMIDVDDFKSYNDAFLHPEGDKALKIVGNCLKDTLRGADVAVRYGGEEFSILLPQTTIKEAQIIAERVRRRIESTRFPHRQITASIGISGISDNVNTVEKLIESADRALFEAKRRGKNNVQTFGGTKQEFNLRG